MKRIGNVGLIAVAMLAITALFGVASASAADTTLCKVNAEACIESNRYPASTAIKAEAISPVITGLNNHFCKKSTMTVETSQQSGNPLQVKVTALGFSECEGPCQSIQGSGLPWNASVKATTAGNGTMSTPFQLALSKCSFGSTCTFGGAENIGTVSGGSEPYISLSKMILSRESGSESNCGNTLTVTAKYNISSPQPMFVSTALPPSSLCSENVAVCPAKSIYPAGTSLNATLKAGTKFISEGTLREECTGSSLAGKTTTKSGSAVPIEITSLTFSGCSPCTTGEALNLPYTGVVEHTSEGDGVVTIVGSGASKPVLNFSGCPLGVKCKFGASEVGLSLEGGNPAELIANKFPMSFESGSAFFCGSSPVFRATYSFSKPAPLFATE